MAQKQRKGNKQSIFKSIDTDSEKIDLSKDESLEIISKPLDKNNEQESKIYISLIEKEQYEKYKEENLSLYKEKQLLEERINDYLNEIEKLKALLSKQQKINNKNDNSDIMNSLKNELEIKTKENIILNNEIVQLKQKIKNIIKIANPNNVEYSKVDRTMLYDSWN